MPYTQAMRKRVQDAVYGATPVAPAATLYVALSTTVPTDTGGNFTRPVGGAYADVAVTNNATNFPAATLANPTVKQNGTKVTFPVPTGSWGTVTHWGVAESAGGAVVDWTALTTARAVGVGSDPVEFAIGALKSTLAPPA